MKKNKRSASSLGSSVHPFCWFHSCVTLQGRDEKLKTNRICWDHIIQVDSDIRFLFHPSPTFT